MSRIVQYSPQGELVSFFREYEFVYTLETSKGMVLTTVNRFRKYLENILHVDKPSKNIIQAILQNTDGKILGNAVNTYGHISGVCLVNIESVKSFVSDALKNKNIRSGASDCLYKDTSPNRSTPA